MEKLGLIVNFHAIGKDLPKVDAILLLKGGIDLSNKEEYEEMIRTWSDTETAEEKNFKKLE